MAEAEKIGDNANCNVTGTDGTYESYDLVVRTTTQDADNSKTRCSTKDSSNVEVLKEGVIFNSWEFSHDCPFGCENGQCKNSN